jgi:hypothetical protein
MLGFSSRLGASQASARRDLADSVVLGMVGGRYRFEIRGDECFGQISGYGVSGQKGIYTMLLQNPIPRLNIQSVIDENGIQLEDIYNFDETGFAMGLISAQKVDTRAEYYGR